MLILSTSQVLIFERIMFEYHLQVIDGALPRSLTDPIRLDAIIDQIAKANQALLDDAFTEFEDELCRAAAFMLHVLEAIQD